MSLSLGELTAIMLKLDRGRAVVLLPHLDSAMCERSITTPLRKAAFMAQIAHESGELRWWEEWTSGRQYEGRHDLGNDKPGDGVLYKGRCPIQLTGKANYRACGNALGVDLVCHPALLLAPEVGFRAAAWYWQSRGCNSLADEGEPGYDETSARIGGRNRDTRLPNGMESRRFYYARTRIVFGLDKEQRHG